MSIEWYAYYHDYNKNEIRPFNVFDHCDFLNDCKKNAKANAKDYDRFCEQLRRDLQYYYWSKCEWELVLIPWVSRHEKCEEKVDVADQIMLNWKAFCDYVWSHGAELRRRAKKCQS